MKGQKMPLLLLAIAGILIPMGVILAMSASSRVELVNGYISISAGDMEDFVWYFLKDTQLSGGLSARLSEPPGGFGGITFYILDSENYHKYMAGEEFTGYGYYQVSTYDIDYRIPRSGHWYMILDNCHDNYNGKGILLLLKESYTSLLSMVSGILSLSSGTLILLSAAYISRMRNINLPR